MGEIFGVVALNAGLAGAIYLLWRWWRVKRPMTARNLRKHLTRTPAQPATRQPCEGLLAPCVALAQATGLGGTEEQLLVTLLTRWVALGLVEIGLAPKRALHGFGADMQLQLRCMGEKPPLTGAEAQLYQRLAQHEAALDGIQESALYLWARDQAQALTHDLSQLATEGKVYLRAHGMAKLEDRAGWFGFTPGQELYTPRGVREALCYRDFLAQPCARDLEAWWLTQPNPPQTPLGTLAQQIHQGMQVGRRAQQKG